MSASTVAEALGAAVELLRAERIEEAEAALLELHAQWPAQPDALHFLGVLRHTQGRNEEAVALIERALEQIPDHADAWNNLGNVLLHAGRADAAIAAYERGVRAAGDRAVAAPLLSNLAVVYRRQGRLDDAESACRQALALSPEFANAWYALSQSLLAQGRVHDGLVANSRAIALWPQHLQARDQVIRALLLLGERERAAGLYREWLAEDPGNPVVQHQLAACIGGAAPPRASNAYVRQLFDAFASSFDAKLERLHYRAPELVAGALHDAVGEPGAAFDIVDAGCGTGLCGPLLKPWARRLAGCDLSEGMLRRAHARRIYDPLHQAELVYYLDTQPTAFDVVVSADTLCYFGDLGAAMAAARRALRPGGWLIFTVEALSNAAEGGCALQPNGRYAHHKDYLEQAVAASGLALHALQGATLRHEAGDPVAGWLVAACSP